MDSFCGFGTAKYEATKKPIVMQAAPAIPMEFSRRSRRYHMLGI